MNLRAFAGVVQPLLQTLAGRPVLLSLRCTSTRASHAVTLPRQVLGFAHEFQLAFAVQWPLLSFCSARRVRVLLFGPQRSARDTPELPSESGFNQQLDLSPSDVRQFTFARTTHVRLRLPAGPWQNWDHLRLEVATADAQPFCSVPIEVLDEPRAQQLRLASLGLQAHCLWVHADGQAYAGDTSADTSDFLVPELTFPKSDLDSVLPPQQISIAFTLLDTERAHRTLLGRKLITLAPPEAQPSETSRVEGEPWSAASHPEAPGSMLYGSRPAPSVPLRGPRVALQDRALFPAPGRFCVVASVNEEEPAYWPFRILSRREWLEQLQVPRIELLARDTDGRVNVARGALYWDRHVAFQAAMWLHSAVPAPGTRLQCTASVLLGHQVVRRQCFLVRLDQTSRRLCLDPFSLAELGAPLHGKRVRLALTLDVNGQSKASWPIVVLPPGELTNFEGQLRQAEPELPVDEDSYADILRELQKP